MITNSLTASVAASLLAVTLAGCQTPPAVREAHEAQARAASVAQRDNVVLSQALARDLQSATLEQLLMQLDLMVARKAVAGKVALVDYTVIRGQFAVGLKAWRAKGGQLAAKIRQAQINHAIADQLHGILGAFLGRSGLTLTDEDKARLMTQVGEYAAQVEANKEAERQREHEREIEALKAAAAEGE